MLGMVYTTYSSQVTSKRILERLGIQTSSSFVKIDKFSFLILKPISYSFGVYRARFFLSRNYWSSLDCNLMASI